jgi:hypothetical protein
VLSKPAKATKRKTTPKKNAKKVKFDAPPFPPLPPAVVPVILKRKKTPPSAKKITTRSGAKKTALKKGGDKKVENDEELPAVLYNLDGKGSKDYSSNEPSWPSDQYYIGGCFYAQVGNVNFTKYSSNVKSLIISRVPETGKEFRFNIAARYIPNLTQALLDLCKQAKVEVPALAALE